MATEDDDIEELPEDPDEEILEEDLDEEDLDEELADLDDAFVEEELAEEIPEDLGEDEEDEEDSDETDEALDELEAEELELLDDEVAESLLVDEAAELRAIRREELTLNVEAQAQRTDEFVCQSCFLVKRVSQLANRRKMICLDCAS